MFGGYQLLFFERLCESDQRKIEGETCKVSDGQFSIFKDCTDYCDSDECNNGKDVELHYSKLDENGVPVKKRCFAYKGEMNSTTRDIDEAVGEYEGIDDVIMTCPRFANQGCFKADYRHGQLEGFPNGYSKGCSMYGLGEREQYCSGSDVLGTTCRGNFESKNLCNEKLSTLRRFIV